MKERIEKYRLFWLTSFIIIVLDQVTKAWIEKVMMLHDSNAIIPGFFNLTLIRNPGAAFGIFADGGGSLRTAFFITVSFVAMGVLTFLYTTAPPASLMLRLALSLVMGGAIGNLIDRIRFGEVVDFLDFYVGQYHWPAFNVADSCISIGVTLLIVHTLFHRHANSGMASSP